jgi:hypothetical protein
LATALLQGGKASCQGLTAHTPTPNPTYNYYYSGNWYYNQLGPVPGKVSEQHGQSGNNSTDTAHTHPGPMLTERDQRQTNTVAAHNKNEPQSVRIINSIAGQRDWIDYCSLGFNFILLLFLAWQLRILNLTYLAVNRPRLIVRHVALVTDPDDLLTADPSGKLQGVPAEIAFSLNNRGASSSKIIEGNITLKPIGAERGGLQDILRGMRGGELLPPLDKLTGIPIYSNDIQMLKGCKFKADEERLVRVTTPVPQSIKDSVRLYMSLHKDRNLEHLRFVAFGYFRYRSRAGRRYITAFCRLYDRSEGEFIPVKNPKYEYRT